MSNKVEIEVEIPEGLMAWAEIQAKKEGHSSVEEYIVHLIQRDMEKYQMGPEAYIPFA